MDAQERVDSFDFNDDAFGYQEVKPITGIDLNTLIHDGKQDLAADAQPTPLKFESQAMFVG